MLNEKTASLILRSPIFAEIVPEKQRTSIYALDRTFESILASFAPPVVGLLSQQVYGFKQDDGRGSSPGQDRENAASLAKALYTAISIPMVICTSIYTFMYRTYPRDRERARMQSVIQSELDQIELLGGPSLGGGGDGDGDKPDEVDGSYGSDEQKNLLGGPFMLKRMIDVPADFRNL